MVDHIFYFTRRISFPAAMLLPLISAGGCELFKAENWNPDHYRDERAVDIDHRLDKNEPIVKSPF